jgi:hypothetical protein
MGNDLRINLILCIFDVYPGEFYRSPFVVLFVVCMWSWNGIPYSRRRIEIIESKMSMKKILLSQCCIHTTEP